MSGRTCGEAASCYASSVFIALFDALCILYGSRTMHDNAISLMKNEVSRCSQVCRSLDCNAHGY